MSNTRAFRRKALREARELAKKKYPGRKIAIEKNRLVVKEKK